MAAEPVPERGHRLIEHTADMAMEAWAPTRTECFAESVGALVSSFVDLSAVSPSENFAETFPPSNDEDLLVRLLEEVIYQLDVFSRIPMDAEVEEADDGGLVVHFAAVPSDRVEVIGAVPKAVSLHELRFGPDGGRWYSHVTVDV